MLFRSISNLQFTVYDLIMRDGFGRIVGKSEIQNPKSEIHSDGLAAGIYFLELVTPEDKIMWRGKIVVSD
mgnify:FL=1